MRLTAAQFSALPEGLDWVSTRRWKCASRKRLDNPRDQLNQASPNCRFGRRIMLLSFHADDSRRVSR